MTTTIDYEGGTEGVFIPSLMTRDQLAMVIRKKDSVESVNRAKFEAMRRGFYDEIKVDRRSENDKKLMVIRGQVYLEASGLEVFKSVGPEPTINIDGKKKTNPRYLEWLKTTDKKHQQKNYELNDRIKSARGNFDADKKLVALKGAVNRLILNNRKNGNSSFHPFDSEQELTDYLKKEAGI